MVAMLGNGASRSFNGDGRPDLLVRRGETGEVLVHPHSGRLDGPATFLPPVLVARDMGWQTFGFVRSLENGTGRADLLAFSLEQINPGVDGVHGLFVLPNLSGLNGLDTFGEPLRISGPREDGRKWETVGMADISGNGADDTFSRSWDGGEVDWFPHTGTLCLHDTYDKDPRRLTEVAVEDFPLAMADFTGNGRLDLLVRRGNGDLDLLVFDEDHDLAASATAGEGTWYTVARGWDRFAHVTLSDIDLDGVPDLLAVADDGVLQAFRNSGKFDVEDPEALFEPPLPVLEGLQGHDVVC